MNTFPEDPVKQYIHFKRETLTPVDGCHNLVSFRIVQVDKQVKQ